MSSNLFIPRVCEFCHQPFIARTTVTRFCRVLCSKRSRMAKAVALKPEAYHLKTAEESVKPKGALLAKEWYTASELIEILGISKKWVYQLIRDGHLDSIKISERRTRVPRESLLAFMAKRVVEPIKLKHSIQQSSAPEREITRDNCYSVAEVMEIFGKNRGDCYVFLKRSGISKIKIKKEVFFSKSEVDKLFRKFVKPRQLGYDKERSINKKLAAKGIRVED